MNQPNFNGGGRTEFRPQGGDNDGPSFRPEGGGSEGRERGGRGGAGWIFGAVKNIGVIALLVVAIAWPIEKGRCRGNDFPRPRQPLCR